MGNRDGLWTNTYNCMLYSYLTGFPDAVLLKDGKEWSDLNWTWWNLAAFPQENDRYRSSDHLPDISTWRM